MEDTALKQQFIKWYFGWRPVESPPNTGNWVAEKITQDGNGQRHFDKNVLPTQQDIQNCCMI